MIENNNKTPSWWKRLSGKKIESRVEIVNTNADYVYHYLSDFRHFDHMAEGDKVEEWTSEQDFCRFKDKKLGEIEMRIVDKEPGKLVKIESSGHFMFNFQLWMQLKALDNQKTYMKFTIQPKLGLLLRVFLHKFIANTLNTFATNIAQAFR